MPGKLSVFLIILLLSGCGTTDVVVKDRRIVCPSDAPPQVCGDDDPVSLSELNDYLEICRDEVYTWRQAWEGCFDD